MKTLTLLLISLSLSAQYVPVKLEQMIAQRIDNRQLGVHSIHLENYRYTIKITPLWDTLNYGYSLLKKEKLYVDYYKAAGVAYFGVNMAGLIVTPTLKTDKWLHFGAEYVIGAGSTALYYQWTHNKWLAGGLAILTGMAIGTAKESWDSQHNGVFSKKDLLVDGFGLLDGTIGAVIVIGHKQTVKRYAEL